MSKALAGTLATLTVACLLATPARAEESVGPVHPYSRADRGEAERTFAPRWIERIGADVDTGRAARVTAGGSPQIVKAWPGRYDPRSSPPDATGAVGPSSYIQLINRGFAIYNRNGVLVSSGGLAAFFGAQNRQVGEPQIHWDPYTGAFYFAGIDFLDGRERIFYGWSRSPKPLSGDDSQWCKYRYGEYGLVRRIPDFPRLGDTQDFAAVGVNVLNEHTGAYMRSDVVTFDKPEPGATASCPASVSTTRFMNLSVEGEWDGHHQDGGIPAFSPVPVVQTDPSPVGHLVAADLNGIGGFGEDGSYAGDALGVFRLTTQGGAPEISGPDLVPVQRWDLPRPAKQRGTTVVLDTLDSRLTQAMSGTDPSHGGGTAIWTQHTILGGRGAAVRWYEIDPGGSVLQSDTVKDDGRFVFNAAISSDRQVADSGSAHGDSMVLTFNTSSPSEFVAVRMLSKTGASGPSPWVTVRTSPGHLNDFTCHFPLGPRCQWGDYAGASPDPVPSATARGYVWLVNEWTAASHDSSDVDWRTIVWRAAP
jgi:hypothetical protein